MNDTTQAHPPGLADLRAAFADGLPDQLARVRGALRQGDFAAVRAIAHTLSGSAATFGCRRVGSAAAALDAACRAADLAGSRAAFDALCAAAQADAPGSCPADTGAASATPVPAGAPLILLVDDDALLLAVLARALEADGFRVCAAGDARQALALLQADHARPQLAVLDIAMPDMSGLDLAAQLDGIPYMFLSASSGTEVAEQAAAAGAVGFLLKPIDPAQLLPAVRAALARAADIHELRAAEQRLTLALREGRETGMAVGVLMERYRIDRHDALRLLRNHARSNHRKLNEVATELLQAAEALNALAPPRTDLPAARASAPASERRK
ncbi:response regulator [uncultured Massilia sp.]|uniref:response regulator n=1 Tax=uncultured Massilia sp. TaxID=169973 RepID=UPI0025ED2FEA|nr:response regulator [uncultured Massilia sp.]